MQPVWICHFWIWAHKKLTPEKRMSSATYATLCQYINSSEHFADIHILFLIDNAISTFSMNALIDANDSWCWLPLIDDDWCFWCWLMLFNSDWCWCWMVHIDTDWCWRMLIHANWWWLILIDSDWCSCWPMLIDAGWWWLMLIGDDCCWLMLIVVEWCWLMLIDDDL